MDKVKEAISVSENRSRMERRETLMEDKKINTKK